MHSEMRGLIVLLLVFFATDMQAVKLDTKPPLSAEQPQLLIATPTMPQLPAKPLASEAAPSKPAPANSGDPDATLRNLPASQRLAISVCAGLFTLIVALWIGARRD